MKNITYVVTHTYNAGLLGASATFKTYEEAKAFATDYMKNFDDCEKFYRITRHETRKVLGFTLTHKVWNMEEKNEEV